MYNGHQVWEVFGHYFIKYVFYLNLFVSPEIQMTLILDFLILHHRQLRLWFFCVMCSNFFFSLFFKLYIYIEFTDISLFHLHSAIEPISGFLIIIFLF